MVLIRETRKLIENIEFPKCDDFEKIIKKINNNKGWKGDLEKGNFTFVEFDIKEQFTNLDKNEALEAVEWMINLLESNHDEFKIIGSKYTNPELLEQ